MATKNETTERNSGQELWTAKRMAWLLGVTDRTFRRLVEEEVITPTLVENGGSRNRRYDPVAVVAEYREYKIRAALKHHQQGSGQMDDDGERSDYKKQIDKYRAALVEQQAEAQLYKNQINRGELVYASEVSEQLRVFFTTFKRFALSIPSRVTGMISGLLPPLEIRRISNELSTEMTAQLDTFVETGKESQDAGAD